jgi:hypothetical protein
MRFFVWTTFVAVFLGCFSWLPTTPTAFGIAIALAVLSLAIDVLVLTRNNLNDALAVAFFSYSISISVLAAYLAMCYLPDSSPPSPPVPFLHMVYLMISGELIQQFADAIGQLARLVMLYFWTFCISTLASATIALLYCKRDRGARWLLLANIPALLFLCYVAIGSLLEG